MSTKKREPHAAHAAHTSHVAHASAATHRSPTAIGVGSTEKPTPVVPNVSDEDRAGTIRVRAYHLWERAGRPDCGTAQERFWFEAEKELTAARASM